MSYPDIKTFLSSCRLDEYTPKFLEMGFDDVDFLINYISSSSQQMQALVKQTNLKPGHIMKLTTAITRYQQQFPGKLIHSTPIRTEEEDSSGIPYSTVPPLRVSSIPFTTSPSVGPAFRQPRLTSHVSPTSPTAESQLEGHMEDLERSLNRLMDVDGDESYSEIARPSSILSVSSTTSVSSAPLSPVSSQSPSLEPSSTPRSGTPDMAILPPPASLQPPLVIPQSQKKKVLSPPALPKSVSPKSVSPKSSISASISKPPETFEVVTIKSSKRQQKKAAKANQTFENCPDGYFCTERFNCKLNHTKDEKLFFRNPLAKTKACTRNLGGVCDKHADNCGYAHSSKDARCLRCRQRGHFVGQCLQTKTRPCRRKNGSVCDRDPLMCGFAHSAKDARCLSCEARGHFVEQCPEKIS